MEQPKAEVDAWSGLDIRRARGKGAGLFATRRFPQGSVISIIEGTLWEYEYDDEPDYGPTWYGVGPGRWIEPNEDSPPRYVNHSCDPNAAVRDGTKLVAQRDISPNEEITIDYAETEEDPTWFLECRCGSPGCRKVVRSAKRFDA